MRKRLLLTLLLGCCAFAQESQPPSKPTPPPNGVPVEAARQVNPVKPNAESLVSGKKWYGLDCAMCHGNSGDGKGEMAADMKQKLADLTDPATLKGMTDGEIFYIIKNGKNEMPPEGDRLKPTELWNVVNYVRSLAKKAPPAEKPSN